MKTKEIIYNIEPFAGFEQITIVHDIKSGFYIKLADYEDYYFVFKDFIISAFGIVDNPFLLKTSTMFNSIEECHFFLSKINIDIFREFIKTNRIEANFLMANNPLIIPEKIVKKCDGIEPINLTVFTYNLGEINDLIYRKIMTENPTVKRKDLAEKLGVNERTIYRELKRLKLN